MFTGELGNFSQMELSLGLCSFIFLFGFTSVVIMVISLCQGLQTNCNGRFSISLPARGKCPCSKHGLHQPWFPAGLFSSTRTFGNLRFILVKSGKGSLCTCSQLSDEWFRPTSSWLWGSLSLGHFLSYGVGYSLTCGATVTWVEVERPGRGLHLFYAGHMT